MTRDRDCELPLAADDAQLLLTPDTQPVNLVEVAKAPGLGTLRFV